MMKSSSPIMKNQLVSSESKEKKKVMQDETNAISSMLYEKMSDSTSAWRIDKKFLQPKGNRKQYPTTHKISSNAQLKSNQKNKVQKVPSTSFDYLEEFSNKTTSQDTLGYWVATEKVHGANFCFVYDVELHQIVPAKRSAVLSEEDSFFGYRSAYEVSLPLYLSLFQQCSERYPNTIRFYAFAELCGGSYPCDCRPNKDSGDGLNTTDSTELSNVEAVQTEILYSNDLHFYNFDLAREDKTTHEKTYINYHEAAVLWSNAGLLWAQPLFVGSFEEVLNCTVDFQTTVPTQLGLPSISGNMAEGVVIKPLSEVRLLNGQRAIVKRKAAQFLEKVQTFSGHTKLLTKGKTTVNNSTESTLLSCLLSLLNANRLTAVRSKIGAKVPKGTLSSLLLADIMASAEEESVVWRAWSDLTEAQQSVVTQQLTHRVNEFVSSCCK